MSMLRTVRGGGLALVLLAAACSGQMPGASAPALSPQAADGRAIATEQCGGCHAVGATGASPRADAPPFRTILSRYRSDALTEDLINGIKIGHPDMPTFALNPQGVDSLLAYLRAIQTPPPAPPKS